MYDEYEDDDPFEPDPPSPQVDLAGAGITITIPTLNVSEETIIRGVCKHFADRLTPVINEKLESLTESAFNGAIRKAADEMLKEMLNRPQRKTNSWGEPVGDPVTMRDYIADRFEKYMSETVDREGRKSTSSYDKGRTRSEWLIETLGEKEVLAAAKVEVEKVRKAAESQISAAVANFIASKLAVPATAPLLPDGL